MKGFSKTFLIALASAFFVSSSAIAAGPGLSSLPPTDTAGLPTYVEGELLVTYAEGSNVQDKAKVREKHALTMLKELPMANAELVKIPRGLTVAQAKASIAFDAKVKTVQPNYIYYPTVFAEPADDPYYGLLWGLHNNAQVINNTAGVADVDIDAPEAWAYLDGKVVEEVVVAVIDTGVDTRHPDLQGKMWINSGEIAGNGKDDDSNGYVDDVHGWNFANDSATLFMGVEEDSHATHVSGTIAARDDQGGVIGIAPNVKIMSLKFLGADGGTTADAIEATYYAKNMGADLSNNSWGGGAYDAALKAAIDSFAKPFIVAAGNSKKNIDRVASYPASYDCANIITVAAVDNRGALASFSNYGLKGVDLGAPGANIASTYPDDQYMYMSGTSMAAPHVTGVTALLMGFKPDLTSAQVKDIVMQSAQANPLLSLAGKTVTGGLVNVMKALELAGGAVVTPPPSSDTTTPYVVSSVPAEGAKNFKKANNLVVSFNETISIKNVSAILLTPTDSTTSVTLSVTTNGSQLVVDPTVAALSPYTKYTLTIGAGAVADAAGNPNAAWSVTFTTSR